MNTEETKTEKKPHKGGRRKKLDEPKDERYYEIIRKW